MAKNPTKGTGKTTSKDGALTHKKSAAQGRQANGKSDTGGVVAYTKGSRFRDAEVQTTVHRILSKS